MKKWVLGFLIGWPAFGIYSTLDVIEEMCWENAAAKKVCLSDFKYQTVVLLYNAGWCPPCNDEFSGMVAMANKFEKGRPDKIGKNHHVVFLSLSCEGWSHGSNPSAKFLDAWETKHGLDKAKVEFHTLASPKDCGRKFFKSPSIPNVAIVAETGQLNYKGVSPGLNRLKDEIVWAMREN